MHCIILNTKTGARYKKNISVPFLLQHPSATESKERSDAYPIYNNTNIYHLYIHTSDMIVKNTISLNHNIHASVVNNITTLVVYINNPPRHITYIKCIVVFTTIYVSMHLIYYTHWNINYNILSSALNKRYELVL